MSEQILLLVDMLKSRINQNFEIIKENEEVIKNILMEPSIENRSDLINKSHNINRKLRDENNDLIRIQFELVNYLTKLKEVFKNSSLESFDPIRSNDYDSSIDNSSDENGVEIDDQKFEDDQIFAQTISGELIYESSHPKFNDEEFYNKLMNYYIESECYEMCTLLSKLKGKK